MRIRYYGHVGLGTGYGYAAAEFCMAMLAAGLDFQISTDGRELEPDYLPLSSRIADDDALLPPDVVIVHTLPITCAQVLQAARIRDLYPRATCIAYTTWEGVAPVPDDILAALSQFDRLWVPSVETAKQFEHQFADGRLKAELVPHAFDERRWSPQAIGAREAERVVRPRYTFYTIGAWVLRKNLSDVVRAYLRAFRLGDPVELRVHAPHGGEMQCAMTQVAALGVAPEAMPPVRFTSQWLSHDDVQQIHRDGDCFCTASHGESWNIPAFDALLHMNHIIAPRLSGSDDYLLDTSADLCHARLDAAGGEVVVASLTNGEARMQYVGTQGLSVRENWRTVSVAELAQAMREAFAQRKRTLKIRYNPAERFGRSSVGNQIRKLLQGAN